MLRNLKQRLKDFIADLAELYITKCESDLLIRPNTSFYVHELNDDFIQTQIHVKRPIDFGLELDSFFCYLEQEDKSTDLSIVSIIPVDKNIYLVTFKQN